MLNINLSVILDGLTWVAPLPLPLHSNKHVSSLDCKTWQEEICWSQNSSMLDCHNCLLVLSCLWMWQKSLQTPIILLYTASLNNCWMLTAALTWLLIASPILCIGVLGLHPARQAPSNWSPQELVSSEIGLLRDLCPGAPQGTAIAVSARLRCSSEFLHPAFYLFLSGAIPDWQYFF